MSSWLLVCQTHRREASSPGGNEDFPMKITMICQWRAKIDELGVLVSYYRKHSIVSFSETRLQEDILDTNTTISSFLLVQEDKRLPSAVRGKQKLLLIKKKVCKDQTLKWLQLKYILFYLLWEITSGILVAVCFPLTAGCTLWTHAGSNNYKLITSKLVLPM